MSTPNVRHPGYTSMSRNTSWVTFVAFRGSAVREFEAITDAAKRRPLGVRRESTADQIGECLDGLSFVSTARFDGDRAADRRSEQHHSDDTACICLRPFTTSHTLQLNLEASCAILADGRA